MEVQFMYMYKELKSLLGIDGRDWTPNGVRALFIMRDFIFVAFHNKACKSTSLNYENVLKDLNSNGSTGALHNLLMQKQLSCLEEIYVDSVFENYRGLMDLQYYVDSLYNSQSRLRYWGYASGVNLQELSMVYQKLIYDRVLDFTYADMQGRMATLSCNRVDNPKWYTRYNLRPDKYKADAPNGSLAMYFRQCEQQVSKKQEENLNNLKAEGISLAVSNLFRQDMERLEDIRLFLLLRKTLVRKSKSSCFINGVRLKVTGVVEKYKHAQIKVQDLQENLFKAGIRVGSEEEFLLGVYKKYNVFDEKAEIDLDYLSELAKLGEGFLGLRSLFSSICIEFAKNNSNEEYFLLYLQMQDLNIPIEGGDVVGALSSIENFGNSVSTYFDLIIGVCGYKRETLLKELKKGENKNDK